jgi:hypothetical protein
MDVPISNKINFLPFPSSINLLRSPGHGMGAVSKVKRKRETSHPLVKRYKIVSLTIETLVLL